MDTPHLPWSRDYVVCYLWDTLLYSVYAMRLQVVKFDRFFDRNLKGDILFSICSIVCLFLYHWGI